MLLIVVGSCSCGHKGREGGQGAWLSLARQGRFYGPDSGHELAGSAGMRSSGFILLSVAVMGGVFSAQPAAECFYGSKVCRFAFCLLISNSSSNTSTASRTLEGSLCLFPLIHRRSITFLFPDATLLDAADTHTSLHLYSPQTPTFSSIDQPRRL